MTVARPAVFIGSSAEGLPIAEAIQSNLDRHAECQIWSQGFFGLSAGTLETLTRDCHQFDFAVLVLTADDLVQKRGQERRAARDNVLFELGLFMGALGRERTYAVFCRDHQLDLPSDLAGVTLATFAQPARTNLRAALGPPCVDIREAMGRFGLRPAHVSQTPTEDFTRELAAMRAELAKQADTAKEMMSIISKSAPAAGRDDFLVLSGSWLSQPSHSHIYTRIINGVPRTIYCYGGNTKATGEYYNWHRSERGFLASFRWFGAGEDDQSAPSGFAFLEAKSSDLLAGGWWHLADLHAPPRAGEMPQRDWMVEATWRRIDAPEPPWAKAFFDALR